MAKVAKLLSRPKVTNYRIAGIIGMFKQGEVYPREAFGDTFPDHALRAGVLVETTEEVTVDFEELHIPTNPPTAAEKAEVDAEYEKLRKQLQEMNLKVVAAEKAKDDAEKKFQALRTELAAAKYDAEIKAKSITELQGQVKALTIAQQTNKVEVK